MAHMVICVVPTLRLLLFWQVTVGPLCTIFGAWKFLEINETEDLLLYCIHKINLVKITSRSTLHKGVVCLGCVSCMYNRNTCIWHASSL